MRRSAREADRKAKMQLKQETLQDAQNTVRAFNDYIRTITSLHKFCSSHSVDWTDMANRMPPTGPVLVQFHEKRAVEKVENFKPSLIGKLFKTGEKRKAQLIDGIVNAKRKDQSEFQERTASHGRDYAAWQKNKDLALKVLNEEAASYIEAIKEFNPFENIDNLGSEVGFSVDDEGNVRVDIKVHSKDVIPDEKYTLRQSGSLSAKDMPKGEYYALYQDYVCSCVLRVARELFQILPIEQVVINATDDVLNAKTGHLERSCILSVKIMKKTLDALNLSDIDPSSAMENFVCNMKFKKTSGFEVVQSISD